MLNNETVELNNPSYLKQILVISLPLFVQGFVIQLQTLINRAFLGNLKLEYLSAMGNIIFPFNCTLQILLAVSTGLTIVLAHKIGAKKRHELRESFVSGVFCNSILALMVFVFWFMFSTIIFSSMGVKKELIEYCTGYIRILELYVIIYGIDISIQSILQATGQTKPIMYIGICKVLLNIFLDWTLIYGNFGIKAMGLYGAALSTTLSNIFSTVLLISYVIFLKKLPFEVKFIEFLKPKFNKYVEIAKVGIPVGFETFIWYIGNLTLIRLLNELSSISVGIYTLTYGIDSLICVVYSSLSRASLTLVGQKKGEKNYHEARKILSACIKYNFIIIGFIFVICVTCSKYILGIFTKDAQVVNVASVFFLITSITFFPKSLNIIVGSGIRGLGNTKWMMYTQIIGTVIVILMSYVMIFIFKLNIIGIYFTILLDESIRSILNLLHFYRNTGEFKVEASRVLSKQ